MKEFANIEEEIGNWLVTLSFMPRVGRIIVGDLEDNERILGFEVKLGFAYIDLP